MKPLAIDLYCGLGGWAEGLLATGWRVIGFDIERHQYGDKKYPAEMVVQDVLTLHGSQFRDADLIVASPPCFVADTLILTARGLVPIPEVAAGDLVLTHRKRWRRVIRTGSTIAPTVAARGYGGSLNGTAEHPIYSRRNDGGFSVWDKRQKAPVNLPKKLSEPDWIPLADIRGRHWGIPTEFDALPVPALPNNLADVPDFWWIVGRWVGDGWVRLREETRSGDEVIICCGHSEADGLEARLASFAPRRSRRAQAGELHWRRVHERTATKFHAASNSLAQWLVTHFGRGAAGKSWPAWALGMSEERRRAMLDGYASADGHNGRNGTRRVIRIGTVSKRLAVGTMLLAASLGTTSNLHFTSRPATCRIEGRVVRQRNTWTASWTPDGESNRLVEHESGFLWGKVREVKPSQDAAHVWNLEVDEDNSYTANGIVVHNCQKYSYMAMPWTKAKDLAEYYRESDERLADLNALFDACFRIQREASEAAGRYIPMVVENVKGAQKWVGRAKWHYGSYYLWGDVPALMPMTGKIRPKWIFDDILKGQRRTIAGVYHNGKVLDGIKQGGLSGTAWFDQGAASVSSRSNARKQASAEIAKIPFALARHIGEVYGNQ